VVGAGGLDPAEAVARRTELPEAVAIALSAVSDADAILAAVGARYAQFAALARIVKAWALMRGLDSAPHGGLPGLAWCILAARTVLDAGPLPDRDLLAAFFGTWAAWDWRTPIALPGHLTVTGAPAISIATPTSPVRLCTEQVGPGWRDRLTQELYEAWELTEAGADPLVAPPLHRRHAAWAVVTVHAVPGEDFDVTAGRVRGRLRALLAAVEAGGIIDAHAWPRPFETGLDVARHAIGLGRTPPDGARLAALTSAWRAGLPGVDVEWADGGAVPTLS